MAVQLQHQVSSNSSSSSTASLSSAPSYNEVPFLVQAKKSSLPLRAGAISYLEYKSMRFVIHDSPSEKNLADYIREFKRYNVTDVVRLCDPTYSDSILSAEGITVHDLQYEDGGVPPDSVVQSWLSLVKRTFKLPSSGDRKSTDDTILGSSPPAAADGPCIAVHCVAGLGRAPVLVAIALIEAGMQKLDAVEFVRRKRRGAFNSRQIQYVDGYRKQSSKTFKSTFERMFRFRSSA